MKAITAFKLASLVAAGLLGPAGVSLADDSVAEPKTVAPLFSGLGDHHHPITTSSKKAQKYFDQGLILCYAFNHREAIRSFRGALKHDPDCAMAYWGNAYAKQPARHSPDGFGGRERVGGDAKGVPSLRLAAPQPKAKADDKPGERFAKRV